MPLQVNPITGQLDIAGVTGPQGDPGPAATPGGAANSLQFNDAGSLGGLNRRVFEVTGVVTTDDTTPVAVTSVTLSLNTAYRIFVEYLGRQTAVGVGAVGDIVFGKARIAAGRVAGGAVVFNVFNADEDFGVNTIPTIDGTANGNDVDITITGGDPGTTVAWRLLVTIDTIA